LRTIAGGAVDRQRVEAGDLERIDQGIDGGKVARLQKGAIEDDWCHGLAVRPFALDVLQRRRRVTRPVEAGAQDGGGLLPLHRAADQRRGAAQELRGVGGAAMD
jgi:hypothetical protein